MINTILWQLVEQGWVTHRSHCRAIDLHDNRQWGNPENRDAECDCGLSALLAAEGETPHKENTNGSVQEVRQRQVDGAPVSQVRKLDQPIVAEGETRPAARQWFSVLEMEHARKQEHANGFQVGWHAALTRIDGGSDTNELRDLVPGGDAVLATTPPHASPVRNDTDGSRWAELKRAVNAYEAASEKCTVEAAEVIVAACNVVRFTFGPPPASRQERTE